MTAAESAAEKLRSFLGLGADAQAERGPRDALESKPRAAVVDASSEKERRRKDLLAPAFRDLSATPEWRSRSSYDEGLTREFRRKLGAPGYIQYPFVDGGYSGPFLLPDPYACFHLRAIDERSYVYSYRLSRLLAAHVDQINRGVVEPSPPPPVPLDLPLSIEDLPSEHGPHPQIEKDLWTVLNFDQASLSKSHPSYVPSSKYSRVGQHLSPRSEIHGLPVEKLHVLRRDALVGHRINYRVFVLPPGVKREETTKSLEERNKIMYYWFVPI
jgi:hypothetical protein